MRSMMMIKATKDFGRRDGPLRRAPAQLAGHAHPVCRRKLSVLDGPFAETKELIGGFAILRAKSKQEALELAKRCVDVHTKAGVDIELEIRPLFDPSDSGPSKL